MQVGYLQDILRQLRQDTEDAASPLFGMLDLQRLATAGHSRGGKLAALHLAGEQPFRRGRMPACIIRLSARYSAQLGVVALMGV